MLIAYGCYEVYTLGNVPGWADNSSGYHFSMRENICEKIDAVFYLPSTREERADESVVFRRMSAELRGRRWLDTA